MAEADLYQLNGTVFQAASFSNPIPVALSAPVPNGHIGTPLAVTASTGNVALPAGAAVLISNIGSVMAFVALGIGNSTTATTGGIAIAGPGALTLGVGTSTYLAAITATGTTTLNTAGIG